MKASPAPELTLVSIIPPSGTRTRTRQLPHSIFLLPITLYRSQPSTASLSPGMTLFPPITLIQPKAVISVRLPIVVLHTTRLPRTLCSKTRGRERTWQITTMIGLSTMRAAKAQQDMRSEKKAWALVPMKSVSQPYWLLRRVPVSPSKKS